MAVNKFFTWHESSSPIQDVIAPLRKDLAALLLSYDTHQLTAISEFLIHTTDLYLPQAIWDRTDDLIVATMRASTPSSVAPVT